MTSTTVKLPKISLNMGAVVAFLAVSLMSQVTFAADRDYFATDKGAIRGVDVVAYFSLNPEDDAVAGDPAISHEYKGATWLFSTEENRELFAADPEKYVPQYGGYCAFAVSHGFTKPVNPNAWNIVDGKLYLNLSNKVERKWLKKRDAAIARADKNWPSVLTACEKRKNCNS